MVLGILQQSTTRPLNLYSSFPWHLNIIADTVVALSCSPCVGNSCSPFCNVLINIRMVSVLGNDLALHDPSFCPDIRPGPEHPQIRDVRRDRRPCQRQQLRPWCWRDHQRHYHGNVFRQARTRWHRLVILTGLKRFRNQLHYLHFEQSLMKMICELLRLR